jgi:hypothetical protein
MSAPGERKDDVPAWFKRRRAPKRGNGTAATLTVT